MHAKRILPILMALLCLLMIGCEKATGDRIDEPQKSKGISQVSTPQVSPAGGLPTPYEVEALGDYVNNPYQRDPEVVDYNALSPVEYRIRSVIEFVSMHNSRIGHIEDLDDIQEIDVDKYGIKNYCQYGNLVIFRTFDDMRMVLQNSDFRADLYKKYGVNFEPNAYYLPAYLNEDNSGITFLPNDNKYYLLLYGYEYTEDGDYYKDVWAVYNVQDIPGTDEIAQFYAGLNDLETESDTGPAGEVFHFTAKSGCAFFEKFGVETNDPATAYIWEQDGVIGVIILPGEHKPENLDLCVLEKHEL